MEVLHQVGAGEEGGEVAICVDDGELALLAGGKDGIGVRKGNALGSGDQVGGHDLDQGDSIVLEELDVSHGNDANEFGGHFTILYNNVSLEPMVLLFVVNRRYRSTNIRWKTFSTRHLRRYGGTKVIYSLLNHHIKAGCWEIAKR